MLRRSAAAHLELSHNETSRDTLKHTCEISCRLGVGVNVTRM